MKRLLFLIVALATSVCHAQFIFELQGQVAYVDDGDTLILHPNKQRIRLAEIDAPETEHGTSRPGQPYGSASRAALVAMMPVGSDVTARCYERDAHGRAVCRIFFNNIDISLEMVRLGHAHAYREYVRDPRIIGAAEHAKSAQLGLWSFSDAVYLQTWRRSCWDKSDNTPLFCSVSESSPVVAQSRPAKTASIPTQSNDQASPNADAFDFQAVFARLKALTGWVNSIKWP